MKLSEWKSVQCTGIYCITNTINHHSYVGQSKNIGHRIKDHVRSSIRETASDYNSPLSLAIRKYGLDNFEFYVLERCEYDKLNEREIYWISKYKSYIHSKEYSGGYNLTAGGKQNIRLIKLSEKDVDNIRKLLTSSRLSISQIAEMYNVCTGTIVDIDSGKTWHDDSISYPIRQIKILDDFGRYKGNCVAQIDKLTGAILNKFATVSQAGIFLGDKNYCHHIGEAISGKRHSAYGYKWELIQISRDEWLHLLNAR